MLVWGLVSLALFHCTATGVWAFSVTSATPNKEAYPNEGAVLSCQHSADFGANPRVEWKFTDRKGSQKYVNYKGEFTEQFASRVSLDGSNLVFDKVMPKDNGVYICEVSGQNVFRNTEVRLTVLVAPGIPLCKVPASVTTGTPALLTCQDSVGSPDPTYKWYKDGVPLPKDPKTTTGFSNLTYNLNQENGNLEFPRASKIDTGSYYCVAGNKVGSQKCRAVKMEVRDPNTAGIVAGVIIFLLLLALLGFGIWYAYKKGYIPKKADKQKSNVVYQPPSVYGGGEEDDGDFKQKSSFVV